jgi:predicted ATPase
MGGYFKWGDKGLVFKSNCDGQQYSMDNVSSGVKSLGCLYLLLHNNHIKSDSFIIFDEIENNLHSDNKILLANWLCRLVKKVGVNIYVNTKSPMFMEAIEVYSMKHKIEDDVSYILLDYSKDNMVKAFNTNRWNVKVLYDNLGDPYDILDKQRIENTFNL